MKIATHFLEDVAGIGVFPMISFFIFFLFFLSVTYYAVRLDRGYVEEVASYPNLEDDESEINGNREPSKKL